MTGLEAGAPTVAVLGVDGGNSKTDLVLATAAGAVLAEVRGDTISHQQVSIETAMARLDELADRALVQAGLEPGQRPVAVVAALCLAGADLPSDERLLARAVEGRNLAPEVIVRNDTLAALRAGSDRPWGVGVICGAGINAVGVAPDGRMARFAALGQISGDRAGGDELGWGALGAAVRARDGRGQRTMLERTVPAFFGLRTPEAVTRGLYRGELTEAQVRDLAPLVFDGVRAGDVASLAIADAMADEVVAFATAAIRRLPSDALGCAGGAGGIGPSAQPRGGPRTHPGRCAPGRSSGERHGARGCPCDGLDAARPRSPRGGLSRRVARCR